MTESKSLKFGLILVFEFKKIDSDDKTAYSAFCLNPTAETIINQSDVDDAFELIYIMIISKIKSSLGPLRFLLGYLFIDRLHF